MFFSATNTTDILTINTNKYSSTLQTKKASDLFNNPEYCSNNVDSFPNIKPYSLIFPSAIKCSCSERTSLSTFRNPLKLKGIITIEASAALTIFILCIATIIYIFNILQLENSLQRRLSEIARTSLLLSSISEDLILLDEDDKDYFVKDSSDKSLSFLDDLSYSIVNVSFVKSTFFNEEIKEIINNSSIIDGCSGISFAGTHYKHSNDLLTIQINYEVKIPFFPFIKGLPIKQSCLIKLYTGQSISAKKEEDSYKVYVTISGHVYHTSKYCTYLVKYSDVVPLTNAHSLRIRDCNICRHLRSTSDYVFISETGDKYHYSLDCPIFSRYIYAVNYSSLDSFYTLCERCENFID